MNKVYTFQNEEELAKAGAEEIIRLSGKSINDSGRFVIALSGGNTPSRLFEMLALPVYQKQLDWKNMFVFWSDERMVPHDAGENNSHQARLRLLDHVTIPAENIFTVQVQMSPDKAAQHYEKMLRAFFKTGIPVFDLVLLGMGEDGHTASLFPGNNLDFQEQWVVAVTKPGEDIQRISFTPLLINQARNVMILVTGEQKANMLKKVQEGKNKISYPIQLVQSKKNNIMWYIDSAAGSKLKK